MELPVRIILADDHAIVLEGLCALLTAAPNMNVIGMASDHYEVQLLCYQLQPDVLLLDVKMPGPSAGETILSVQQHCLHTKVLVLTAYDDYAHIQSLVSLGIAGYVLKGEPVQTITQAIATVAQGGIWFSHPVMTQLAGHVTNGESLHPINPFLTKREHEVLQLIADAKTNQEIALALNISEKTVAKHVNGIFAKLCVTSRVEAAVRAVRDHLV